MNNVGFSQDMNSDTAVATLSFKPATITRFMIYCMNHSIVFCNISTTSGALVFNGYPKGQLVYGSVVYLIA